MWGAGAGYLGSEYGAGGFTAAAAAFGGLVVLEYWMVGRRGDTGTTTEAAAFAAFIAGVLVWNGEEVTALALAVGVAALLQSKAWVHGMVSRFSDEDLRALIRFGVLTAVILPLVPNESMGPFEAINPFRIGCSGASPSASSPGTSPSASSAPKVWPRRDSWVAWCRRPQ